MKYLLDTHIVLWLAENSPKLSDTAKAIILDEANEKYVSIALCEQFAAYIIEAHNTTPDFFILLLMRFSISTLKQRLEYSQPTPYPFLKMRTTSYPSPSAMHLYGTLLFQRQ